MGRKAQINMGWHFTALASKDNCFLFAVLLTFNIDHIEWHKRGVSDGDKDVRLTQKHSCRQQKIPKKCHTSDQFL